MRKGISYVLCLSVVLAGACHAVTLDEAPAEPGDWGYRPESGARQGLNPPPFSWRPCKDTASYVVQVAADEAFDSIVYESEPVPWSAHCPPRTFEPGEYFWRYAALDKDGARSSWSKVRSFSIANDAVAFPQPPVAELLTRMPAEHPRLFFRPEDLPRLRELAQGPLAEDYAAVIEQADKLLKNPPDKSEPPKYPEDMARPSQEWKKIWWGNRIRMIELTNGAATLAFAYQLSGREEYGTAARDLLMAFAQWNPKGSTNYKYNDEAAMPGLYYPARTYSWVRPLLSEEDRAKVVEVMRVRGGDCFASLRSSRHLWRPYNSHHNRAWHWLGEVALAFHGEIPEAEQWLDYSMTIMFTTYPVWSDDDGGWHEGSAYWSSYLIRFMFWADVMRSAFDIDVFQKPYFKRAGDYGMYLLPPGTEHGGFGDQTTTVTSTAIADLMAVLAAGARNPYWNWFAEQTGGDLGGGCAGFLRAAHSLDLDSTPPKDLPSSTCFSGVGLAVFNTNLTDGTNNVQVHFKSSPFFGTQSHGYNANNSFLLNLRGKPVLVRSGRRDIYGSEHHKNWMWQTKSDNAILVNGQGQYPHSTTSRGKITAFETSAAVDVTAGEAGEAYENLDRWTRRIVFFKPHAILIHDILEAPEPSEYQWLLHAKGAFEFGKQQASWSGDAGKIDVRFLAPPSIRLTQTDQFDPPPAEWTGWDLGEWHLTAQPADKADRMEFLTLIVVDGADVRVEKAALPDVELTLPDGKATLSLRDDGFSINAPGFSKEFQEETRPE